MLNWTLLVSLLRASVKNTRYYCSSYAMEKTRLTEENTHLAAAAVVVVVVAETIITIRIVDRIHCLAVVVVVVVGFKYFENSPKTN